MLACRYPNKTVTLIINIDELLADMPLLYYLAILLCIRDLHHQSLTMPLRFSQFRPHQYAYVFMERLLLELKTL